MPSIEMSDQEFGQLMFILANSEGKGITWGIVNPLMMKIGEQLRSQSNLGVPTPSPPRMRGNKEIHHE